MTEFDIVEQFGFFVGDNASNNDSTFINALNRELNLNLIEERRIRCAGYIINLVVKAIIYGNGVSQLERDLAKAPPKTQFSIFRKHSIVGKVHNLVNAILASNKRREAFLEIQIKL